MRVGADERVGERHAVARLDHAGQVLQVDLVDDPGSGRHDLEVVEGRLPPAQEGVALAVPLELALDVVLEREPRAELVDLHRMVDHELGRNQRVDLLRIAAEVGHGVSHPSEVDHRRDAGEVLQQRARRHEGDLTGRLLGRHPGRDRLDVLLVARPKRVLEQDAKRVGEPRDVVARLQRVESEDRVARVADHQLRSRFHKVDSMEAAAGSDEPAAA